MQGKKASGARRAPARKTTTKAPAAAKGARKRRGRPPKVRTGEELAALAGKKKRIPSHLRKIQGKKRKPVEPMRHALAPRTPRSVNFPPELYAMIDRRRAQLEEKSGRKVSFSAYMEEAAVRAVRDLRFGVGGRKP